MICLRPGRDEMNLYWLRSFWFGTYYYSDNSLHKHYFTVTFANRPNVDAHIWLTIFSPGIDIANQVTGTAAAGVKSYRYIDDDGNEATQSFDDWVSHARVRKCLEITFSFHIQRAWSRAEGQIIYWTD